LVAVQLAGAEAECGQGETLQSIERIIGATTRKGPYPNLGIFQGWMPGIEATNQYVDILGLIEWI
jgi:hypothetical protein